MPWSTARTTRSPPKSAAARRFTATCGLAARALDITRHIISMARARRRHSAQQSRLASARTPTPRAPFPATKPARPGYHRRWFCGRRTHRSPTAAGDVLHASFTFGHALMQKILSRCARHKLGRCFIARRLKRRRLLAAEARRACRRLGEFARAVAMMGARDRA